MDADFPIAYRALGPLDSIIQTAGRCNREGRHAAPCPVTVFRPKDGGHLPRGYEQVMKITHSFLERFEDAQARIHLPSFYERYFAELYGLRGPESCLADPVFAASAAFNFPKVAQECQLVGNETRAVLVKNRKDKDGRDRAGELADKLEKQKHLTAAECREAQRYSVNLYLGEFFEAQAKGYIYQPAEKPIRFLAFRRNEVKSRLSPRKPEPLLADEDRTQRNTLALRDVEYVIEASLHLTPLAGLPHRVPANDEDNGEDSPVKYLAMFQRRAEKGQCFAQPCFGCREFPAHFELADESAMRVAPGLNPDTDLGLMLYDVFNLDVPKDQPPGKVEKPAPRITFFPATLKEGVMNVPDWNEMKPQLGGAA